MSIKYIPFLLLGFILTSCGGTKNTMEEPKLQAKDPYEKIKALHWIIGKWEADMHPGLFTETWAVTNDSVYSGFGIGLGSGKDTTFSETISIAQRGNDIFYMAHVSNQNAGKPTEFKMTSSNANTVVFENPMHDFPQKITYELKGDSMIAWISGKMEGKDHLEKFPMVKAKPNDVLLTTGSPDE